MYNPCLVEWYHHNATRTHSGTGKKIQNLIERGIQRMLPENKNVPKETVWIGHHLSEHSLKPNTEKTREMEKLIPAKTQNKMNFFLGAVQYFSNCRKKHSNKQTGYGDYWKKLRIVNWTPGDKTKSMVRKMTKKRVWHKMQPTKEVKHQKMQARRCWEQHHGKNKKTEV